jgi:hypothetical protein
VRPVLFSAFAALLLVALAIGMLHAIYYWQVPVQSFPAPQAFPQPRVQTGQRQERQRLEAEQEKRLNTYRWVDQKNGLVEIPIARAMQILAGEGMKAYQPLAPPQALSSPEAGAERLTTPQAATNSPGPPPLAATPGTPQKSTKTPATPAPAAPQPFSKSPSAPAPAAEPPAAAPGPPPAAASQVP